MERVFNSIAGHETYACGKHKGYVVSWKELAPLCRSKWSGNRASDPTRIEEMLRFREEGGYMPLFFHLAELSGEGLVCYDGNHRREVLLRSKDDPRCVVDVMFDATPDEVLAVFENVNKSVQVPALYVSKMPCNAKKEILDLVDHYEVRYKGFKSSSPHPQCPNFNRDNFVANVTAICDDFGGAVKVSEIGEILDALSKAKGEGRLCKPHCKYADSAIKKCREHNFWLFLDHHVTPAEARFIYRELQQEKTSHEQPRVLLPLPLAAAAPCKARIPPPAVASSEQTGSARPSVAREASAPSTAVVMPRRTVAVYRPRIIARPTPAPQLEAAASFPTANAAPPPPSSAVSALPPAAGPKPLVDLLGPL